MRARELSRRLVLETPVAVPDGAGGMTTDWSPLGTHWATFSPGSGREATGFAAPLSKVRWTITVRATPVGSAMRPLAGQRFREGDRLFAIHAVAEADTGGRYLDCRVEEERVA